MLFFQRRIFAGETPCFRPVALTFPGAEEASATMAFFSFIKQTHFILPYYGRFIVGTPEEIQKIVDLQEKEAQTIEVKALPFEPKSSKKKANG